MRWINFLKKKKCSSYVISFFFFSNTSMENSWFWNIWHISILNYTYECQIISLFFRVKCVYWFNYQRNSNSICVMPSDFFMGLYIYIYIYIYLHTKIHHKYWWWYWTSVTMLIQNPFTNAVVVTICNVSIYII